jgi:hypothetical protein
VRVLAILLASCSYDPSRVTIDAPPDARFDLASCPSTYDVVAPTSRYRVIENGRRYGLHYDDCADDLPGATHLAAIIDRTEQTLLQNHLANTGIDNRPWVGVVQLRDAGVPTAGWLALTGEPVPSDLWQDNEPNDQGGTEDNDEQFANIGADRDLTDDVDGNRFGICECDGRPIAPDAAAAVAASR